MAIQFSNSAPENAALNWFLKVNYILFEIERFDGTDNLERTIYNLVFEHSENGPLSPTELLKLRNRLNGDDNSDISSLAPTAGLCFYVNSERICTFLMNFLFEYVRAAKSKDDKDSAVEFAIGSLNNWLNDSKYSFVIGTAAHRWILHKIFLILQKDISSCRRVTSLLRKTFQDSLEIFPQDSVLWCYYVAFEHVFSGKQKLRGFFEKSLKNTSDNRFSQNDSPIIWLHYLAAEYFYDTLETGRSNRLRRMFERCLSLSSNTYDNFFRVSSATMHSPVIWRFYLKFEVEESNFENAKKILFRSITSCPWSKKVWIDSLQLLWNFLSISEVIDLFDLMFEKEINVTAEFNSFSKYVLSSM
jgi:hypothetical protein